MVYSAPAAHEIAAGVDDLAPQRPPFPVAVVRGVHAKDDQKAEQRPEHCVFGRIENEQPRFEPQKQAPFVDELNHDREEGDGDHAQGDDAQGRSAEGEDDPQPVVAVVFDHAEGIVTAESKIYSRCADTPPTHLSGTVAESRPPKRERYCGQ